MTTMATSGGLARVNAIFGVMPFAVADAIDSSYSIYIRTYIQHAHIHLYEKQKKSSLFDYILLGPVHVITD